MSFKKLLVPVNGGACDAVALAAALAAAKPFDAHVAALFVHADMREAIPFGELPLSPDFVQDLIDTTSQIETAAVGTARDSVAAAAAAAGVAPEAIPAARFGLSFAESAGGLAKVLVGEARFCDLMVFACIRAAEPGNMSDAFARVLTKTACPLLLVPDTGLPAVTRRIAVGWDGSPPGARALKAAMPFLAAAESVELLTVRAAASDPFPDDPSGYLALHGVRATRRVVAQGERKTGEALLAAAAGADLLVAGGYGHSRLSETLFGGVTEHLMTHATLPIFMAH